MLKFILIFYFLFNTLASEEYFLTLRNDKVNLRLGPSFDYPIKIIYKKKYLPVLIKDKSENFRKIQDHENNSGWIHISQLSKRKSAVTSKNLLLYSRPTIYSKPLVNIEIGRLLLVTKCKNDWCKIKSGKYSGWIKKDGIWGRL
jgi:SH3-like domain-containing protein